MGKPKKEDEARNLGRDEGVAWAVAHLVNSYGTGTESMEMAQAWGMKRLIEVADESDLPALKRLCKDYPGKFPRYRSALRKGANRGKA